MRDGQPATIKATDAELRLLRLVAAHTGERQYEVLRRLLRAELTRVQALETPCAT